MKVQIVCLSVLAALSVGPQIAAAADFGTIPPGGVINGGIRDYGGAGGVPVPAPVPIPEFKPSFYFRLDAGVGLVSDPTVSESGFLYGADAIEGPFATHTSQSSWFDSDFNTFLTLGGGVGYYFGHGFRMDGTIEKLSKGDATVAGGETYDTYAFQGALPLQTWQLIDNVNNTTGVAVPDGVADQHTRVTVFDKTSISRTAWMLNAYYDFENQSRFTPYVGAGLGFSWDVLTRDHSSTTDHCNAIGLTGCAAGVYTGTSTLTVADRNDQVSLAAAAMVGVSMDVVESVKLDLGYRFLYLGGSDTAIAINGNTSTVRLGAQTLNELHAGLRFDIN